LNLNISQEHTFYFYVFLHYFSISNQLFGNIIIIGIILEYYHILLAVLTKICFTKFNALAAHTVYSIATANLQDVT
ncbi:hypothetical protein MT378_13050, partial [Psychrobacter sp. 16-Bac2893]